LHVPRSLSAPQVRHKTDAKAPAAGDKKKVQPLSFGIVTRVKDGVAFARDLGFASFGELVIFVPSPRYAARPRGVACGRYSGWQRAACSACVHIPLTRRSPLPAAVPAPLPRCSRLKSLQAATAGAVNYVDGMIVGLERDLTSVVILGNERLVKVGDRILARKGIIAVNVGVGLLGRVLNPLGNPIDDKNRAIDLDASPVDAAHRLYFSGEVKLGYRRPVEVEAAGIIARKSVNRPLLTGISSVDSMVPIGLGQRELIIGDRQVRCALSGGGGACSTLPRAAWRLPVGCTSRTPCSPFPTPSPSLSHRRSARPPSRWT
jgi:hypothetical protein